jgi:hypothetical protein
VTGRRIGDPFRADPETLCIEKDEISRRLIAVAALVERAAWAISMIPVTRTAWSRRPQDQLGVPRPTVPYDWAPSGTPHTETPVRLVDVSSFRVPE